MKRAGLAAAGVAALVAAACWDFNGAYTAYCAKEGCVDSGIIPTRDAGHDAGNNGVDSGVDAGPGPCGTWDQSCAGPNDCCNSIGMPSDGGEALGCGPLNICEDRPLGCLPDGYACVQNGDCCNNACQQGHCYSCASGSSFASCGQADQCCMYDGVICGPEGTGPDVCHLPSNNGDTTGAHCISDDFCSTGNCHPQGADGICVDAGTTCAALNGYIGPDVKLACCNPNAVIVCLPLNSGCGNNGDCCSGVCDSANGSVCDAGTPSNPPGRCTLPPDAGCLNAGSCSTGNCIDGWCAPPGALQGLHQPCRQPLDCIPGTTCDQIAGTCETKMCFPQQPAPGYGGCCTVEVQSGQSYCHLVTGQNAGTQCLLGGSSCSAGGSCCSGNCQTYSFLFTSYQACADVNFLY